MNDRVTPLLLCLLAGLGVSCDRAQPPASKSTAQAQAAGKSATHDPATKAKDKGAVDETAADGKGVAKEPIVDTKGAPGEPTADAKVVADETTTGEPTEDAKAAADAKAGEFTESYLVWEQLDTHPEKPPRHRTTWIESSESGHRTLGTVDQLLIAHGDYVFGWQHQTSKFEAQECGWSPGAKFDRYQKLDDNHSRFVVQDRYEAPIQVHEPIGPGPVEDVASYFRTVEVTGNVGPYVFTRDLRYEMECEAANGGTSASATIIDLRTRSAVDLAERLDQASYTAIESLLIAALSAKDPEGEFSRPSGPADVTVATLRPMIERDRIRMKQQLAVETCHACEDDEWESSTLSVFLPVKVDELPDDMLKVPKAVQGRLGPVRTNRARGFSAVTTDAAAKTVRGLFASRR